MADKRYRVSFGDFNIEDRVNRATAAQLCVGVSARTMEAWAQKGKGPKFQKFGTGRNARVVYRVGDLIEWLNSQTVATP